MRQQRTNETRWQYLSAARKYCRQEYNRLRGEDFPHCSHCSHYAAKAMELTEKRFVDLETFGVEGWCDDCGRNGISYLNMGDPYESTIVFDSESERFMVSAWFDIRYTNKE